MNDETPVQGTEGGVSPVETTNAPVSGVVENTTTPASNPLMDVETLKQKYERDINQMKSSLQKQTAQVEREARQRVEDLQRQLHQTRMQSMNEEDRARYERQLESEEFQSLQSRLAELEQRDAQQAATVNAFSFFIQQGVPADRLNLAEGYDAVVQNGWQFLTEELTTLRAAKANPAPQSVEPAPLKPAPSVVTDKGTPSSGTTWAALRASFGSDEAIYRAIEEGRLDPSVLPS